MKMKCGSCRDTEADNYTKIKEDDNLFEILKRLNPRRPYNTKYSYFCSVCIDLARVKLLTITKLSDQNANSFTALNTSTSSIATNASSDEYDHIVMSKFGSYHCHKPHFLIIF